MPNPLTRPGYQTAVQPSYPDVPKALTPEEHKVWELAHNVPYRGAVDHGINHGESVPVDLRKSQLTESIYEDDEVDYEKPTPITPIPVYVVREDEPGTELKMFRTSRGYAPLNNSSRVLSRSDGRTKAQIKNIGTVPIWIGHDSSTANAWNGYRVDANSEFTTATDQDVWVVADSSATDNVPLALYVEYSAVNPA